VLVVKTVMRLIDHCRNPAHRLLALPGQEELHLCMLEKRVFARIEEGFAFKEKRGDPEVITPIHPPWEPDKGFRSMWR
jgi:hypothetical protein